MKKTTHFNLNEIRLKKLEQNVIKSVKKLNTDKLPPTDSAGKYHSYRVYHQVKVCLGNDTLRKMTISILESTIGFNENPQI